MSGIKGEIIRDEFGNIIRATGAQKTALTNKERYGEDWYKQLGRKGGSVSTPTGGFGAVDKHGRHTAAQIAGAKGGKKSRRGKTADRFIVAWTDANGTAQTRKFKYAPSAQKFADNVNSVVLELPEDV